MPSVASASQREASHNKMSHMNNVSAQPSHSFKQYAARGLATLVLLLGGSELLALSNSALKPSKVHGETAAHIVKQLENAHYAGHTVNDALSAQLLERYLDKLDPSRLYFLQEDIDRFQKYRSKLDNQLRRGNVSAGFQIYEVYQERIAARQDWILSQLESLIESFDYTEDDYLKLDRSEEAWPKSMAEADSLWTRQLKASALGLKLSGKTEEEILERLSKRFKNQKNRLSQNTAEDVFSGYMNALGSLYDPHTDYFSPRSSENFQINMSLKLEGIGAVLQVDDEYTKVVRVVPGGPAAKQGQLKASDRIVGVAQGKRGEMLDVIGWRLDDVVDKIRGPKGSIVRLQVIPASAKDDHSHREITIVRNEVKLEEQSAQKHVLDLERNGKAYKVGVISIPTFYLDFEALRRRDKDFRSTTKDVKRLLDELQAEGVSGIVIDLRNNGGGSLVEANGVTSLFIEAGATVQVKHSNSRIQAEGKRRRSPYYTGPLVVLQNRLSASASEIFAGAIQDYKRGLIIGTQSFGKGTVQSVNPLNHGQLKLTESKFYRISGDSTQNRGVIPDVTYPAYYDKEKVGESSLDNAMAWDRIQPVKHAHYYPLLKASKRLQKLHDERVRSNPDFVYLREQIAYKEELANIEYLSLNEQLRERERKRDENTRLAMLNKLRAAKGENTFANFEEAEAFQEEEAADLSPDKEADAFMIEAGEILVDALALFQNPRIARRSLQ